ncbi:MAG: Mur ligase family protein [Patescibacteria group bacterium]|nr:Mur ligase family protein [Patescibacteria group bacterium]
MTAIKKSFRRLIVSILTWEARLVLKKYKPRIIGVTGNVGKTSTKDAIYSVLQHARRVRRSDKSYNNELGTPLTILGCPNAWCSPLGWLKNIFEGLSLILFSSQYPSHLVLEIGADRPGDIAHVIKWIKFDIVVLTCLPDIPVHLEYFDSVAQVAAEKLLLPQSVAAQGAVILNCDDERSLKAVDSLKAKKVVGYGLGENAGVKAEKVALYYEGAGDRRFPAGLDCQLVTPRGEVDLRLPGLIGWHQLSSILAAVAVGLVENVRLEEMAEALLSIEKAPGRMRLLPGIKDTLIIDDSYNASPLAAAAALEALGRVTVIGDRIAVLGDMMELGNKTMEAHKEIGRALVLNAHILITVGLRSKFIAEEAHRKKMGKRKMHHFDDAREAGIFLQGLLKTGDIVLVKGSQSIRLERAIEEIMLHPENKTKLLCRQEPEWQKR